MLDFARAVTEPVMVQWAKTPQRAQKIAGVSVVILLATVPKTVIAAIPIAVIAAIAFAKTPSSCA
jgi:hypothetical protein